LNSNSSEEGRPDGDDEADDADDADDEEADGGDVVAEPRIPSADHAVPAWG
jgi:hypothetical protein